MTCTSRMFQARDRVGVCYTETESVTRKNDYVRKGSMLQGRDTPQEKEDGLWEGECHKEEVTQHTQGRVFVE